MWTNRAPISRHRRARISGPVALTVKAAASFSSAASTAVNRVQAAEGSKTSATMPAKVVRTAAGTGTAATIVSLILAFFRGRFWV